MSQPAAVGRSGVCPRLRPAGGSRGQQRAAQRWEERRWRATAGRDFKSPSFPPNPSFSSPPPGRRGGCFHRLPRALARPCSVSGDRQQPASKSLIISLFFFFLLLLFGGSRKRVRQGRAQRRDSWDHGPGAGARGAPAALPGCPGAPGRGAVLRVRGPRALSRPGVAGRGVGGPMGRAHTCPPGSGA